MATTTYDLIDESVLTSSATSVTFSGLPSTYKDLVMTCFMGSASSNFGLVIELNGSSSGYYGQVFETNGSSRAGGEYTAGSSFVTTWNYSFVTSTLQANTKINIFDYTESKHKAALFESTNGETTVSMASGRWANTAAVTSITVKPWGGQSFITGSEFRIFGLVA